MYGELQLDPCGKWVEEIADMTDEQIMSLAACSAERAKAMNDKTIQTVDLSKVSEEQAYAVYAAMGRRIGLSEEQIQEQYEINKKPKPIAETMEEIRRSIEQLKKQNSPASNSPPEFAAKGFDMSPQKKEGESQEPQATKQTPVKVPEGMPLLGVR